MLNYIHTQRHYTLANTILKTETLTQAHILTLQTQEKVANPYTNIIPVSVGVGVSNTDSDTKVQLIRD